MGMQRKPLFTALALLGTLVALSFPALRLALDMRAAAPASQLTADGLHLLIAVVLAGVACATLIGGRYVALSLALYLFALSRAAQPAGVWMMLLARDWRWLGAIPGALIAGASIYGFVALCVRTPTGHAIDRWRMVDRMLPAYAVLVAALYGLSIVGGPTLQAYGAYTAYAAFGTLIWAGYLIGLLAYLDRRRLAVGEERLRSRWVALAISAHVLIEAGFLALNLLGHGLMAGYLFMLNPAPYAFAYALVRGRIVDVRVFGGRALVYAVLTSIPLIAFALLDWFFARELENIRLAGIVELGVAVAFSFWLQTLHRRIERFVERVMFARRHRAHIAVERMIAALPFVERTHAIETMLVRDVPAQLAFSSAAIYDHGSRGLELRAAAGVEGLPPRLDPDDPLVLYPRSSRSLVSLRDIPSSRVAMPAGPASPAWALPVIGGNITYAIVLYGEHSSAEPISAEEESLLLRLAHGAASAYAHLLLKERDQEIRRLRARLADQSQAPVATPLHPGHGPG